MLSNFNTVSFLWGCPVSCEFVCCCAVVNLLLFSAEIVCVLVFVFCVFFLVLSSPSSSLYLFLFLFFLVLHLYFNTPSSSPR